MTETGTRKRAPRATKPRSRAKTGTRARAKAGAKAPVEAEAKAVPESPEAAPQAAAEDDAAPDPASPEPAATGEEPREPEPDLAGEAEPPATVQEPAHDPEPEPVHAEAASEHGHEDEPAGPTLAGRVLRFTAVLVLGFALALWVAPKIAPYLPNSVAQYLVPTVDVARAQVEDLRVALEAERQAADGRIAALSARIDALADAQSTLAENRNDIGQTEIIAALQADLAAASEALAALAPRVTAAEAAAGAVAGELDALQTALANVEFGSGEGGAITLATGSDIANAVASLASRVEALDSRIAGLAEKSALDAFAERLAGAETALTDAAAVEQAAAAEAERAARDAEIARASAELGRALRMGRSFAAPLAGLEAAAGSEAPEALRVAAASGVVLPGALRDGLGVRAHAAIAASIAAGRGEEGVIGDAETWLMSRFTGRPVTEQAGDDPGAILSRVEARLKEDDLAAALAEAETLPDEARAALGEWLDLLRTRVGAEAALAEYLETIGASG